MTGRTLLVLALLGFCAGNVHAQKPLPETSRVAGETRNASSESRKPGVRKVVQRGEVSWYGPGFAGRKTASGERFDPQALTMAHRSLPLGAIVEVTNNANGRHVRLRVNDRGPYCGNRVADLSRAASQRLGFVDKGVADATIRVVSVPDKAVETLASETTQQPPAPSS